MDDYLSKPIDSRALLEAIGHWLSFDHTSQPVVAASATESHHDAPIDLTHLHAFTDGDIEEEQMLFEVFLESADDSIRQLEQYVEPESSDDWRRAAHRLKGAAGNLGAKRLFDACLLAEQTFDADRQNKQKDLQKIRDELRQVRQFIDAHGQQLVA